MTDSDTAARQPVRLTISPRHRQPPPVALLDWIQRSPQYRPMVRQAGGGGGRPGFSDAVIIAVLAQGLLPGLFNLLQSWVDQQRTEASIRIQAGDTEVELPGERSHRFRSPAGPGDRGAAGRPGARFGRRRLNRRRPQPAGQLALASASNSSSVSSSSAAADVLLEVRDRRRAGDRQHHRRAAQQPGQRELRGRRAVLARRWRPAGRRAGPARRWRSGTTG